jgi:hypothetical protein
MSWNIGIYMIVTLMLIPNSFLMIYIFTATGGLMVSYLLYQSKLVPRFISILGLIGYGLFLIATLLELLGYSSFNALNFPRMIFYIPGGIFEVILPVWLIIKGFNNETLISASEKMEISYKLEYLKSIT